MSKKVLINPENTHTVVLSNSDYLWAFLFGPFYFLYHDLIGHTAFALILALLTAGFSHLIYMFIAPRIVESNYRKQGYCEQRKSQRQRMLERDLSIEVD